MTRVDFVARERHFVDHLAPVWHALPDPGPFWVPVGLAGHAADLGVDVELLRTPKPGGRQPGRTIAVASYGDLKRAGHGRRVIYFEHGCGLTYQRPDGPHGSYAGGPGRDAVALFICPNELAAAANRAAYPDVPTVVTGSPKLDALAAIPRPSNDDPVVAVSFHWDCQIVPETRSAAGTYLPALHGLARRYTVLGHAHPRAWADLRGRYRKIDGVTPVRDFADVVARADLYVCDNSSTIYEWAALDRPVVVLNSPHYRRDVRHGLRFWDHVPGIEVDHPADLAAAVATALDDPPELAARRRAAAELVYPHVGAAAQLAAAAIEEALA